MERLKDTHLTEWGDVASSRFATAWQQNKVMIIITSFLLIIAILFLVIVTPIINHHLEVQRIKWEIEKVQLQIEFNKEQWNVCKENMDTRHSENEDNRKILNDLMQQYNDMVGFTKASTTDEISIRVSPITWTVDTTEMISDI